MSSSRYILGIDLGTSNSALAFIDSLAEPNSLAGPDLLAETASPADKKARFATQVLPIGQWTKAGVRSSEATLSSTLYFLQKTEKKRGLYTLEGQDHPEYIVGAAAFRASVDTPDRVASSAKSWLSQAGIDPRAPILPWRSEAVRDEQRLSPLSVSSAILKHLGEAWNEDKANFSASYRSSDQETVITVPASFDEVAQQLTLEAAQAAGWSTGNVRLLEEPQAAFYAWLERCEHAADQAGISLRQQLVHDLPPLSEGPIRLLVCDIGGGTSDFSLFSIELNEQNAYPTIKRLAVSEHILLGGDNLDLALAHAAEQALKEKQKNAHLSSEQWHHLIAQARQAKLALLQGQEFSADLPDKGAGRGGLDRALPLRFSLPGTGSSLFASSLSIELPADLALDRLLEGFFPACPADTKPEQGQYGLREGLGLAYAHDPRITAHLAHFVHGTAPFKKTSETSEASETSTGDHTKIHAVLFNGGTMQAPVLRDRLCKQLQSWQAGLAPIELATQDYSLAVARGAAYFAGCQRAQDRVANDGQIEPDQRLRIEAGYPRSVYLELPAQSGQAQDQAQLFCLVEQGQALGTTEVFKEHSFQLKLGQPVRFQLHTSLKHSDHKKGQVYTICAENAHDFHALPPMQTVLGPESAGALAQKKTQTRSVATVHISSQLSDTGLLHLHCEQADTDLSVQPSEQPQRYQLSFHLQRPDTSRSQQLKDLAQRFDPSQGSNDPEAPLTGQPKQSKQPSPSSRQINSEVEAALLACFGKKPKGNLKAQPKSLVSELETVLKRKKQDWTSTELRAMWDTLEQGITRRGRSVAHEVAWLNLTGYALRPGYGFELDSWRMERLGRLQELGLNFPKEASVMLQWWVLWRRVAGGLDDQQQRSLVQKVLPSLRKNIKSLPSEACMMVASMERIPRKWRVDLAHALVDMLTRTGLTGSNHYIWALSRLLTRTPLYGTADCAVPADSLEEMFGRMSTVELRSQNRARFVSVWLPAIRKTGDRYLDVPESFAQRVRSKLTEAGATEQQLEKTRVCVLESMQDKSDTFGESLPHGLALLLP